MVDSVKIRHGQKLQNYRWNFDAIYHSSRDISISDLGKHIAISGCRSLSQSLSLNSPWWKRTYLLFFYLNSWGLFHPQAQDVCVKIEAQYEIYSFISHCVFTFVSYAEARNSYRLDVRPSVRLSVRHTLAPYQNGWIYCHAFFTTR